MVVGEIVSLIDYYKIKEITDRTVLLEDVYTNEEISLEKRALDRATGATSFSQEMVASKTEIVNKLLESGHSPFTVEFVKTNGETRVLSGTFLKSEPLFGRSLVKDLLSTDEYKIRAVDHRTIKSLILKGIKYHVRED